MSYLSAVLQAIIQGLTEFLPVSSSGHLSLYQHFTGNSGEGALMFSAILHLGTLLAVVVCFRKQLLKLLLEAFKMIKDIFTGKFTLKNLEPQRRLLLMFVVSTAVLIPLYIFKDFFESFSEDASIFAEGLCFLYTSALLFMADRSGGDKTLTDVSTKDALCIGFFQSIALLPGVSRSGSTISAGLFSGLKKSEAVSYSFILGIPAILGGCLVEVKDGLSQNLDVGFGKYLVGFIVAAVVGFAAIKLVNLLMKTDKYKIFVIYTAVLGVAVIVISIIEMIIGHPITL